MIELALLVAVVLTSTLSGIFGMAGGILLMAAYLAVLPVADAMVLHGVTQVAANGFRWVLLWRHVAWRPAAMVVLGSLVAAAALGAAAVVLPRPAVMILLGALPLLGLVLPLPARGVERPGVAVGCGVVATSAQLTAGVSGPLLDLFFVSTSLNRFQVVATKAFCQSLGHGLKLLYFGVWVTQAGGAVPGWFYAAAVVCALAGTRIGGLVLARLAEHHFRRHSRLLVGAIGAVLVVRGALSLL